MFKTASKKMTSVKKAPASNRVKVASIKPIHPIKSQSLSKEDIVKLVGELLQKEFARLGVHLPDDEDGNKETVDLEDANQEDDAMDIDLVRLENASSRRALYKSKDLLAMEGRVEGTAVQILADTCANLSWIPKSLAEELGMEIDISRTHKINGVSGEKRSLGVAKNVLIELQTGCIIKEDMAVVNYPHQEIGLSRTCLRRYNYDIHESREHVALFCNGKNFFIPIVPDKIRNKE